MIDPRTMITSVKKLLPSDERKKYQKEFVDNLNMQAKTFQRITTFLTAFVWISFAIDTDPKLHPEFPELIYFRLGLTALCSILFVITFIPRLRGKGLGIMYLVAAYLMLTCAFFTGRIADDPNYVAGLQIILLMIILLPGNKRVLYLLYLSSAVLFVTGVIIYRPVLNSAATSYSMNNLVITYVIAFAAIFILDRLRFSTFYDRLKLAESNTELIKTRDALWGEMELAKKIQTVLLPDKPELRDFEVAAFSKPADEVGGDYYDIISANNRDWVVIGDVSGHGVPAGLIMMMVQTAIKVALQRHPEMSPSELLSTINHVITENIHRLNEDKYMTITVLACYDGGMLHYSGLHQNMLVYRHKLKTVEVVETSGMWLGLIDDISPHLNNSILAMEEGDTVLLFTDGITESWGNESVRGVRQLKTSMFGEDRLQSVFTMNATRSCEEIKKAIIESLIDYFLSDDITMVIMKKKA